MVATYQGKIVANPSLSPKPMAIWRGQSEVDEYISNNTPWSEVLQGGQGGPTIDTLVYEDGSEITDYVNIADVPGDAESLIVFEPKFYQK